ncbi:hypothetical protein MKK55_14405 [Methylobacterium sp. J-059]|uniref:hypothetical protein n=1 Tax=Methylobacterium sp. J-059 TaxID=2836643 RepID=UPI001FBBD1C6|nr:hypothetical protein [Methylobacterium sp. J-059]MCJ2040122.1 hypothetical protein [Methylobacterium sp. J-059]
MAGSSALLLSDKGTHTGGSTPSGRMPDKPGSRRAMDRGALMAGGILEGAGLPPFLQAVMSPWVVAIETGTLGMREMVAAAASSTAANLKRRVVVDPALDLAIAQAVVASVALAEELDKRDAAPTKPRAAALAAVEAVIAHLRTAAPNEDTRALGLGW